MVNTTLGCVKTIFNCKHTVARGACVNFYKCNIYLLGYLNAAFSHNLILADAPEPWQYGFQDPATPVMEGIVDLHHDICFFLIVILVFVLWMLSRTLFYFNQSRNPIPEKNHSWNSPRNSLDNRSECDFSFDSNSLFCIIIQFRRNG